MASYDALIFYFSLVASPDTAILAEDGFGPCARGMARYSAKILEQAACQSLVTPFSLVHEVHAQISVQLFETPHGGTFSREA